MKPKPNSVADPARMAELRHREETIRLAPSAEEYVALADAYHVLGLAKESDRLLQLAEELENAATPPAPRSFLSGTASSMMIAEVIQILSRTKVGGDLTIEAPAETFHLFFERGYIINASSQQYEPGTESFRMALRVSRGTYTFHERPVQDVPRLIEGKTDMLLLDAMHFADAEAAETIA